MTQAYRIVSFRLALAACVGLPACAASGGQHALPAAVAFAEARAHTPIAHVVLIVQENRTFDNFFATYPGANGATSGKMHNGKTVQLKKVPLEGPSLGNGWSSFDTAYDNGKMDGFDLDNWGGPGHAGKLPYSYVDPNAIAPYWMMAKQYVLGDEMFQGQGSGSFTAHQELVAGGDQIDATQALINWPSSPHQGDYAWGCDAPKGTVTSLITKDDAYESKQGPFPCLTYESLANELDAKHISWRYYSGLVQPGGAGYMWNAYDAIQSIREGGDWSTDISTPSTNVLRDVPHGKLASVTWVTPSVPDSDHEYRGKDHGPSWVASVVNAIGKSRFWNTTAIVIVWDDWGGHYDHVVPQQYGYGELGFRVPLLVVSPYVRAGRIVHTQYEFGSILRFIEDNWGLEPMQAEDTRATSIAGAFDFSMKPRPFQPISAPESIERFLHEPPSNYPPDGP